MFNQSQLRLGICDLCFRVRWQGDELNEHWYKNDSFVPTDDYDASMEYMSIWLWGASLAAYLAHMVSVNDVHFLNVNKTHSINVFRFF